MEVREANTQGTSPGVAENVEGGGVAVREAAEDLEPGGWEGGGPACEGLLHHEHGAGGREEMLAMVRRLRQFTRSGVSASK